MGCDSRWARLQRALANWLISTKPLGQETGVWNPRASRPWLTYGSSLALVAAITAVGLRIEQRLAPTNVAMLYLLAVVISALRWGRGPSVCSAVAGAVAFDLFLIPPYRSVAMTDVWYAITFLSLLVVGLLISALAGEAREQAEEARRNQAHTAAMYAFSHALASAGRLDEIVAVTGRHIFRTFHWPVLVALPAERGLTSQFCSPEFPYGADERAAAAWAFEHGETAGRGTRNFPAVEGHYVPLITAWGVRGVLGLRMSEGELPIEPRLSQLLETFASRAALAIGRAVAEEKAREAKLLEETERLQRALLNSISHNLRTPLATVTGALKSLIDDSDVLDEPTRRELLVNAQEQAACLNRLVGNLLDMTRLEAGAVRVKREPCDIQDVVGAAIEQLGEAARRREIRLDLPAEQLLVPLDFVLITQVLVNLLDNALKYSPSKEPVEIEVRCAEDSLEVAVSDRGTGIVKADLERVFERFQRGSRNGQTGGTGLGLSISKGFVEAHGGHIWAVPRAGGGTRVMFAVPMSHEPKLSGEPDREPARA